MKISELYSLYLEIISDLRNFSILYILQIDKIKFLVKQKVVNVSNLLNSKVTILGILELNRLFIKNSDLRNLSLKIYKNGF